MSSARLPVWCTRGSRQSVQCLAHRVEDVLRHLQALLHSSTTPHHFPHSLAACKSLQAVRVRGPGLLTLNYRHSHLSTLLIMYYRVWSTSPGASRLSTRPQWKHGDFLNLRQARVRGSGRVISSEAFSSSRVVAAEPRPAAHFQSHAQAVASHLHTIPAQAHGNPTTLSLALPIDSKACPSDKYLRHSLETFACAPDEFVRTTYSV